MENTLVRLKPAINYEGSIFHFQKLPSQFLEHIKLYVFNVLEHGGDRPVFEFFKRTLESEHGRDVIQNQNKQQSAISISLIRIRFAIESQWV